jgi:hypothetical protein
MTRLILTTSDSGGGCLKVACPDDVVIPLELLLCWGRLPSEATLAKQLAAPSPQETAALPTWLSAASRRYRDEIRSKGLGLIDLCATYDLVELWVDPSPNAQLNLIWLLSLFRAHGEAAARLSLRQVDFIIGGKSADELAEMRPSAVGITGDHLETADFAWQAWRGSNPQGWFNLLAEDLSGLPQLRRTVLGLLEELPWRQTGLGATEMRILQFISKGNESPKDVFRPFPGEEMETTQRVFGFWELGELLDGLARCRAPAVAGLGEGPFTLEMHEDRERHRRYYESRLSLTPLGEAILVRKDDFSRHNPVHRWWGGTELTNDRLWRWDPENRTLVAP